MKRAFALLVVVSCSEPIHAERFARVAESTRAGMLDTGPRGIVGHATSRIDGECEPGDFYKCTWDDPELERVSPHPYRVECRADEHGRYSFNWASCSTPLVVAWGDAPVRFTRAPASFAVGPFARTEWPTADTPWLALDRDGSGCIESQRELFAGFSALAALDANGDGVVDARDPAFADLVLWSDMNGDKSCTPDEIAPLGIASLPLVFERPAPAAVGSYEGERADLMTPRGRARLVDVYLAPL